MDRNIKEPTDASLRNQSSFLKWGKISIDEKINKYNRDVHNYISDFLTYHKLNNANKPVMDTSSETPCYLEITDDNDLDVIYVDHSILRMHVRIGTFVYNGDNFAEIEQKLLNRYKVYPTE